SWGPGALLCLPEGLEPSSTAFSPGPHPPGSCSGCEPVCLPLLAGLMAAHAVVSLLIIAAVFVCACPRHRPTQGEDRDRIMPGRIRPRHRGGHAIASKDWT
uniref:Hematopoietic cell signal transducer n=1 Tax=Canis lupus dingo TaxID=286419 RepID=A0A8C0KW16_CANLU